MDIIRFNRKLDSQLDQGEFISGATSIMWLERYQKASEFNIKGPLGADLRRQLPVGSFISHMDSNVPMIVENHALTLSDENESLVEVTGRSVETVFENRIVGATGNWMDVARYNTNLDVTLGVHYTWEQLMLLMNKTIYSGPGSGDPDDDFYGLSLRLQDDIDTIAFDVATGSGLPTPEALLRQAKVGTFYDAMLELLAIDNLGITATWRPWDLPGFGDQPNMRVMVYKGLDRAGEVIFSDILGDLESAEYLWSIKTHFNSALAVGRWVSNIYKGAESGWDRRYITIDAKDIDNGYEAAPTVGPELDAVSLALYNRARDTVLSSRATALAQANSRKGTTRYQYRKDYNIGDIVGLEGDYDEARNMQVVEYVEIDDETGESGYPTFAPL